MEKLKTNKKALKKIIKKQAKIISENDSDFWSLVDARIDEIKLMYHLKSEDTAVDTEEQQDEKHLIISDEMKQDIFDELGLIDLPDEIFRDEKSSDDENETVETELDDNREICDDAVSRKSVLDIVLLAPRISDFQLKMIEDLPCVSEEKKECKERKEVFYVNVKSKVFHRYSCGHYIFACDSNIFRVRDTYDSLLSQGYRYCKSCKKFEEGE